MVLSTLRPVLVLSIDIDYLSCVIPLTDKTGSNIVKAFTKISKVTQPRKHCTDSGKRVPEQKFPAVFESNRHNFLHIRQ